MTFKVGDRVFVNSSRYQNPRLNDGTGTIKEVCEGYYMVDVDRVRDSFDDGFFYDLKQVSLILDSVLTREQAAIAIIKAGALREAADEAPVQTLGWSLVGSWLRDRADELDGGL